MVSRPRGATGGPGGAGEGPNKFPHARHETLRSPPGRACPRGAARLARRPLCGVSGRPPCSWVPAAGPPARHLCVLSRTQPPPACLTRPGALWFGLLIAQRLIDFFLMGVDLLLCFLRSLLAHDSRHSLPTSSTLLRHRDMSRAVGHPLALIVPSILLSTDYLHLGRFFSGFFFFADALLAAPPRSLCLAC